MSAPESVDVKRWSFRSDDRHRLNFEVEAQRGHVKMSVTDNGYSEESRLGLSTGDSPERMKNLAASFRQLADTLDAACDVAAAGQSTVATEAPAWARPPRKR